MAAGHDRPHPAAIVLKTPWCGRAIAGSGCDPPLVPGTKRPDTTEDTMFTRTSLLATALLLAAAPVFAQGMTQGTGGSQPSSTPSAGVQATAPRATTPAPAVSGTAQPGASATVAPAKPAAPAERHGSTARPAQDGKVAGQPATPAAPTRTN